MRTGRSGAGLHAALGLVAVLGVGLCLPSWAFFPTGGFHPANNTPVFPRWSMDDLDTTGNGQVVNDVDGVLVTIDVGEGGYTPIEAQAIRDAFRVWQDVPGAYMAFRFQEIEGPFPVLDGDQLGEVNDPFNSVTLGDVGGALGITYRSAVVSDEALITDPVTGQQFIVHGPRILEADIVFSEAFFRPDEEAAPEFEDIADLLPANAAVIRETMPTAVGYFFALNFTPLNNSRDEIIEFQFVDEDGQVVTETITLEVEDAVVPMRGADGVIRTVGATPTMYNNPVFVEEADSFGRLHAGDLAYDDIAGVMFLYPRLEQQDELFTISHEARTAARPGFTSSPIVGAHVIAWVDHDRNPTTGRLPLISTMSGLYNNEVPIGEISGRFQMFGLFKRIIDQNGNLFSPDYVLTIEPLPEDTVSEFDSMHTPLAERPSDAYNTLFPFEVYNENGNLFSRDAVRNGTPLFFDTTRRQVVSRNSGLTLAQQLPRNTPMFGEKSDVCFLDLVGDPGTGGGGAEPPAGEAALTGLRSFRDNVMLRSRIGAAASDAYYRVAPSVASFLVANEFAFTGARSLFAAVVWLTMLPSVAWAAMAAGLALVAGRRVLGRRARVAAAGSAAALALLLATSTAHATFVVDSPGQMVRKSDAIVAGEITAVHSYYSTDMLPATIVTDVSVSVSDSFKGGLNKGSTITVRMPGGQVGNHYVESSGHPHLRDGEEVVLMLSAARKDVGLTLAYGTFGTFRIAEGDDDDEEAGGKAAKRLVASSVASYNQINRIARAVNEAALKRGVLKSADEAKSHEFTLDSFAAFVQEAESQVRR